MNCSVLPSLAVALDLGEGFPAVPREVIDIGERALSELRVNTVGRWISAGAAWTVLQNVAMARSRSNRPTGRRYSRVYEVLSFSWPNLAKADKSTRSNAIWLFQNSDAVTEWLQTLPQNQRDKWTHPAVIRRHYERRHPRLLPKSTVARKPRHSRQSRSYPWQPLGERSREDLEAIIAEQDLMLVDRDHEIAELNELAEEQRRQIEQLRNDLLWERTARRQAEIVAASGSVIATRPGGAAVKILHAISRASYEVPLPLNHGYPDYPAWAKLVIERVAQLSAPELHWLLADNAAPLDAYERAFPQAGVALEDRIRGRIAELEQHEADSIADPANKG